MYTIGEILAEAEIRRCIPVMRVLRPHLEQDDTAVVGRILRQMADGYRLLALLDGTEVLALTGFRFQENLVFGRSIYIDDLVVAPEARRQGHAEALLQRIREIAGNANLRVIALDTALTNVGAQKVYERCGYEKVAYHLIRRLPD